MLPQGYPPLEAYEEVPGLPLFQEMRAFAREFHSNNRRTLRRYAARWSRDPLHRWSRRWEYLFVTQQAEAALSGAPAPRLLDAGAGLTFFAHWLAHRNPKLQVECSDRDRAVASAAPSLGPPALDRVSYATHDLAALPQADASCSAVSCISVLEHTRDRDAIIREFARILRPGGVLILTFDLSLDGRWEIPLSEGARLLEDLERHFAPAGEYGATLGALDPDAVLTTDWAREHDPTLLPWRFPHPADMLRRFPNVAEMFKPRFKSLTCFCGTWRKPD